MNFFEQYLGEAVHVEISGEKRQQGLLVDIGQDILVIYDGKHFLYIPFAHIQHLQRNTTDRFENPPPSEKPIENGKQITYRNLLNNAKGLFMEIYVTDKLSVHGYVVKVMTDYFVFYSPVYKTMFIPLFHLKWFIPYNFSKVPYSLDKQYLPVNPSEISLVRTFEEQLKKLEGKIVVFDLGLNANKIGLLQKVENQMVELITADEKKLYWNVRHLKTVHSPYI